MTRWKRWRALSPAERGLRVRALLEVARVRLELALLPFARVRRRVDRDAIPRGRTAGGGWPGPADVDRAVRSAAALVPGATCLARAMAARVMLGRAGLRSGLRLGVARDGAGGLDAHAWVECEDGTVVGDGGRPDHAPVAI